MRNNNLAIMAMIMIFVLFLCATTMELDAHRLVAILAATLVACVYLACESRVMRAHAPLRIIDEGAVAEKNKPPEDGNE